MSKHLKRLLLKILFALALGSIPTLWITMRSQSIKNRLREKHEAVLDCRRVSLMNTSEDVRASLGKPVKEEAISGMYGPGKRLWYKYPIADEKYQPYFETDDRTQKVVALDCRETPKSRMIVPHTAEQWSRVSSAGVLQKDNSRY